MEDVADVHTRQSVVNEQRIRRVRPNRKMNQVHILRDNAKPHTSLHTRGEIAAVVWNAVPHPSMKFWGKPQIHSPWRKRNQYILKELNTLPVWREINNYENKWIECVRKIDRFKIQYSIMRY